VLTRRVAFKPAPNQASSPKSTSPTKSKPSDKTLWEAAEEGTRTTVKALFLESLSRETHKSVRNKVCDTIAEMARACNGKGGRKETSISHDTWERMIHAIPGSKKACFCVLLL
jgi:hypothetical protein